MALSKIGTDGISADTAINGFTPTASNMAGRNRIINGAMVISQRGTSFTPSGNVYSLDRWITGKNGGATVAASQSSTAPAGFRSSLLFSVTSGATTNTTDYNVIQQSIEGYNTADLAWGTASASPVTLSFWVRSSQTGTFGATLRTANNTRSYCGSYTINSANTWEYKTILVPGCTDGTHNTTTGTGIDLLFDCGVGTTYSGSNTGSWQNANYLGLTGGTKLTATTGANIYITGVQLEAGSVATPFEHRQYGQELALCQRYAVFLGRLSGTYTITIGRGMSNGSSSGWRSMIQVPYPMRATPALTAVNLQGWNLVAGTVPFSSFGTVYLLNGLCLETDINYTSSVGGANLPVYLQTVPSSGASYLLVSAEL